MMTNISVQPIGINDVLPLQAISKTTFSETFAEHNSFEDLQKYLNEQLSIEQLLKELGNHCSSFYFLKDDRTIVGYLKVNWSSAQTELIDLNAFEIERIYILRSYFGKGFGQILMNHAMDLATNKNASYIWLGVWGKNDRAIRFYEKNGFTAFSTHLFTLGNDIQTDILMKKSI